MGTTTGGNMNFSNPATPDALSGAELRSERTFVSAVSWGAVFAGAAAAAALSLILLILGIGLGLSSMSPWVHTGIGATTFGVSTIAWLTIHTIQRVWTGRLPCRPA